MAFLVGQQGTGWTLVAHSQVSRGQSMANMTGYTATAGTATTAYFHHFAAGEASAVKVFVYNSGGTLVGQSGAISTPGGALYSAALDSSIVLTAQTYYLVIAPSTNAYIEVATNTGASNFENNCWSSATLPYGSPPGTLPAATDANVRREFIVWLDGTVGGGSIVPQATASYRMRSA